ncbi:unnamed protein product [Paramecium sonneborni]|uniref:Uncharacterized protein n=1 Tax=Paramecium sonneborni TaxID=65129 RepID=A0A8S1PMP2_9CILI|nr:unnamed protein product [Paramecium sonneborni]
MIQSKMLEDEEELHCSFNHKLPILMVACDLKLKKNQRLLCSECIENLESQPQLMNFKKALKIIEENQKQKKEFIENVIMINIKLIEKLLKQLSQLKFNVIQQLDQLIGGVDQWIEHLLKIGYENATYSFFDQLDNLINKKELDEFNQKSLIDQINQINQSWDQNIEKKLNLFKSFQDSQKGEEILTKLRNINETKQNTALQILDETQKKAIQVEDSQKHFENQLMINKEIEFQLIDDSNKQIGSCYTIAFNMDESIMVSNEMSQIKIWNFEQGRFKLSNCYNNHSVPVLCLVYSKKTNNFISGCIYQEIICWQQINQNEWKCSKPFKQHSNSVQCLILNKQEDQLISGGNDHKIIVWKVDFIENELTFLYFLDKHSNRVLSLSFNQSETLLASCEKGLQGKWEFKYNQVLQYGKKIHFLNDEQFLWVTKNKEINDILVFELLNGVFQQNSNKTITLIKNNECEDYLFFSNNTQQRQKCDIDKKQASYLFDKIIKQWHI